MNKVKIIIAIVVIVVLGAIGYVLVKGTAGADVAKPTSRQVSVGTEQSCPSQGRVNPNYSNKSYVPGVKDGAPYYNISVSLNDDYNNAIPSYKARLILYKANTAEEAIKQTPIYDSGIITQTNNNNYQANISLVNNTIYYFKAEALNPSNNSATTIMKSYDRQNGGVKYTELIGFTAKNDNDLTTIKQIYIDIDEPECEVFQSSDTINITGKAYASEAGDKVKLFTVSVSPESNPSGGVNTSQLLINVTNPPSTQMNRFWYEYSTQTSNLLPGTYIIEAKATNSDDKIFTTSRKITVNSSITNPTHDLSVTSFIASPNPVKMGQQLTLTTKIKNLGTATESNLVVTDSEAIGKKNIGKPQTISTLKPGEEWTVSVRVKVNSKAKPYTYTLKSNVSTVTGETNTINNTASTNVTVN